MKSKTWVAAALIILTVALAGCAEQNKAPAPPGSTQGTGPASSSTQTPVSKSVADLEATVESVYSQTNPSVVNIRVVLAASPLSPAGAALGSGFVWDTQGNIVTNNHVVDSATRITVTFSDGTTVEGSLVGADADSDLAVVKVNTKAVQLQPVVMGDSTHLKIGQLAIAIGNPFGLQNTMTVGFISGLGRLLPSNGNSTGPAYSIPDIIQTDASINPGNSGGVLLDDTGKVIGVPSSIDTTSGSSAGVAFAIPSAIVQQVVPALVKTGHYDHPYLGISVVTLDPDLATAMNLPADQRGALINGVNKGGPADKAGLQASNTEATINNQRVPIGGDVVIAYNGQTVKSSNDLIALLARSGSVGQEITLTVLRGGKQVQVPVTLGVRPAS